LKRYHQSAISVPLFANFMTIPQKNISSSHKVYPSSNSQKKKKTKANRKQGSARAERA
jgi:hypothetical protein